MLDVSTSLRTPTAAPSRPMFASLPEFHLHIPEPIGEPGVLYCRALSLPVLSAWFVMTLRAEPPKEEWRQTETFLLSWDSHVADALGAEEWALEALMFVAPERAGRRMRWIAKQVTEVWDATDPKDDSRCILMVTEDGQEHSGLFMEVAKGLKRGKLLGKVKPGAAKRHLDS